MTIILSIVFGIALYLFLGGIIAVATCEPNDDDQKMLISLFWPIPFAFLLAVGAIAIPVLAGQYIGGKISNMCERGSFKLSSLTPKKKD